MYTMDSVVDGRRIGDYPRRMALQILRALNDPNEWWNTGVDYQRPPQEPDVVFHFIVCGGALAFALQEGTLSSQSSPSFY